MGEKSPGIFSYLPGHIALPPLTGSVAEATETQVAHAWFGINPVWNVRSTNWSNMIAFVVWAFARPAPTVPVMPKFPVGETPLVGGVLTYQRIDGEEIGFDTCGQSTLSPVVETLP